MSKEKRAADRRRKELKGLIEKAELKLARVGNIRGAEDYTYVKLTLELDQLKQELVRLN